jgi:hypothetical protein
MSITSAWYLPLEPSSRVTASSPEGASRFKTAIYERVFNDNLDREVVFDDQDNRRISQRTHPSWSAAPVILLGNRGFVAGANV